MSEVRAKLLWTGSGQVVQLPQEFRFPEGQTEVLVRREGNRLILESVDEWPEDFRACLGAWTEETEQPQQPSLGVSDDSTIAPSVAQDENSGIAAFFGTWPGDETEEELLAALKAIR